MKVIAGQSLFDIAIQESGSLLAVFDWAIANGISATAQLLPGTELKAPAASSFVDVDRQIYFKGRNLASFEQAPAEASALDYLFPQTFPLL